MRRTTAVLIICYLSVLAGCELQYQIPTGRIEFVEVWAVMADTDGTMNFKVDHPASTESAELSPDETLIASVARGDDSICLWDAETGQQIWKTYADNDAKAVTFTRDGRFVITGGADCKIRIIDVETGTIIRVLDDQAGIEGLCISHSGQWLATGNKAGQIKLWDIADPEPDQWSGWPTYVLIQGPDHNDTQTEADVNQVDWTKDDRYLLSAGGNGVVKIWDIEMIQNGTTECERVLDGISGSVKSVRLSADQTLVAAGGQKGPSAAMCVWDFETGELIRKVGFPHTERIEAVIFSPNGQYLLAGGAEYPEYAFDNMYAFSVADIKSQAETIEPATILKSYNQKYLYFSKDGSKLVVSHQDGALRLYRVLY